jgi:hypothetical protein
MPYVPAFLSREPRARRVVNSSLWGLFVFGVFCILMGFLVLYQEHTRQDWMIADAHVLSIKYPDKDHYLFEVSYRVQARNVTAEMNAHGHPSFNVNDTISVKIDPDNSEHFVFNQPSGGPTAFFFLMGIVFSTVSFFLLRVRARRP